MTRGRGRRLAAALVAVIAAVLAWTGPAAAQAPSPVVELVERLVPAHDDLDGARDAFAHARATAGEGSPEARRAARDYARESDRHAARTAAVAVRTDAERELRAAMAAANRGLAADLRSYAAGVLDGPALDRRLAEARARAADRIAALVPAVAAGQGLDDTTGGRGLARAMAPVILLVIGVVGLAAITRRRSAARRSRTW